MPKNPKVFLTQLVLEAASITKANVNSTPFPIKTQNGDYVLYSTNIQGDLCSIYSGYENNPEGREIILKLVKNVEDNDLLQNEIKNLKHLQSEDAAQLKHLPKLLDQFKTATNQFGVILTRFDGYDLKTILEQPIYQKGIPQEHVVWIFSRLLSVLGYAHKKGIIHSNVEPKHILIQPSSHNLCLIDWSCSVDYKTNDSFKVFNEDFSAPEIVDKKIPMASADLYSAGKCMIYLLGGDIKDNSMPDSVDPRLQQFVKYFLLPSPLQRCQDAWQAYNQLDNLRKEIWGSKSFKEFAW